MKIELMNRKEHIERAAALMKYTDKQWDENGWWVGDGAYVSAPVNLTLAGLHLKMAELKEE